MADIKLWRYVVKPIPNTLEGWAFVLMDSSGMFATVSDFGNYAYKWNDWGEGGFREFFLQCHTEYLSRKLNQDRPKEYNGKVTFESVSEFVLQHRRDGGYNKAQAREEWDLLIEYDKLDHEHDFHNWLSHTRIGDAWEYGSYQIPTDLQYWMKKILPRLDALVKEDVARERGESAA